MAIDPTQPSYCHSCGKEIHRAIREVSGRTITVDPKFCRYCGHHLFQPEEIDKGNEIDIDEIDDKPFFDDLADFDTLEQAIKDAVPEQYKELPVDELRRQIVGAL